MLVGPDQGAFTASPLKGELAYVMSKGTLGPSPRLKSPCTFMTTQGTGSGEHVRVWHLRHLSHCRSIADARRPPHSMSTKTDCGRSGLWVLWDTSVQAWSCGFSVECRTLAILDSAVCHLQCATYIEQHNNQIRARNQVEIWYQFVESTRKPLRLGGMSPLAVDRSSSWSEQQTLSAH